MGSCGRGEKFQNDSGGWVRGERGRAFFEKGRAVFLKKGGKV